MRLQPSRILLRAPKVQERVIVYRDKPVQVSWRDGMGGKEFEKWRGDYLYDLDAIKREERSFGYKAVHSSLKMTVYATTLLIVAMSLKAFNDVFSSGGITEYKQAQVVPRKPEIKV